MWAKAVWKQLVHGHGLLVALLVSACHNCLWTELHKHLSAGTAWVAQVIVVHFGNNDDAFKLQTGALGSDSLHDGTSLGADAGRVGSIFNVTSSINLASFFGFDTGSDFEA